MARRVRRSRAPAGAPERWLLGLAVLLLLAIAVLGVLVHQRFSRPPETRPPLVVFLGDSYTAGTGASEPSLRWVERVGGALGWDVRNHAAGGTGFVTGVSGDAAPGACGQSYCESFLEAGATAAADDPDVVVLSGGRNDADLDDAELRRDVGEVLTALQQRYPDADVYVTNPLWDDSPVPDSLDTISEALRTGAEDTGATFLDLGQPLADRADRVSRDGVHPDDEGHAAIADAFLAAFPD